MDDILAGSFNRCSAPSQLKITDIRFTDVVGAPMHCTLMKIYTNQGIVPLRCDSPRSGKDPGEY